jgi:hypothetical protein
VVVVLLRVVVTSPSAEAAAALVLSQQLDRGLPRPSALAGRVVLVVELRLVPGPEARSRLGVRRYATVEIEARAR